MEESEFFEPSAAAPVPGPLAGISVVEATTTWAGPMCGCILADLGADVVKIEVPGGEVIRRLPPFLPGTDPPLSFAHAMVNRNKRSISLDLRTPGGRAVLLDLAERADVVVQNFCPGTMDEWGLGYDDVRRVNPAVVYVSISGFGTYGPDHHQNAYDPLVQAASGFMSLNGSCDGDPVRAPTFLSDDLAGLHGALGTLAALHHRGRTGEGQHVDVAMLDALLFQSNGYLTIGALGMDWPRRGNEYSFASPANTYRCRDGAVYIGVILDSQWMTTAAVIGGKELAEDPGYATIPGRLERRDAINAMVGEWAAGLTVAEVTGALREAGVPVAKVRTYAESAADPHVRARGMLTDIVHPDGTTLPITSPPAKFSRTPIGVRTPAPAVGAHTDEVLGELGYDAERIARLHQDGVI